MSDSPSSHRPRMPARLHGLLPFLGSGATNADIAAALGLSKHTVENYVSEMIAHHRSPGSRGPCNSNT